MTGNAPPSPTPNADSRPYWEALAGGHVSAQRCERCGAVHVYPVAGCQVCGGTAFSRVSLAGTGSIYSYTVIHRPPIPAFAGQTPYILAIIDLEGGGRILAPVAMPTSEVRIGVRVRLAPQSLADGIALPRFVADGAAAAPL